MSFQSLISPIYAKDPMGSRLDGGEGPSDFMAFLSCIVGVLLFGLFVYAWLQCLIKGESDKEMNKLGCFSLVGIIVSVLVLISVIKSCS